MFLLKMEISPGERDEDPKRLRKYERCLSVERFSEDEASERKSRVPEGSGFAPRFALPLPPLPILLNAR